MDKKELENELIDAIYWHCRKEYAMVKNFLEKENNIDGLKTASAEEYYLIKLQNLIKYFKSEE